MYCMLFITSMSKGCFYRFYLASTFSVVQKEVADLLKGKVLVGHSVQYDLKVKCLGV